ALDRRRQRRVQPAAEDDGEERDRHRDRDDPRGPQARRERRPGHVVVREHDDVREIRAGEEERRGVGHEHRAVEKRLLAQAAVPRRVQEHGREEDDRRVEVQDGGDDRRDEQERGEERSPAAGRAGRERPELAEQPLPRRRCADEQEAGDERERRPRLREGVVRVAPGHPAYCYPKKACATAYHSGGTVFSCAVASASGTAAMSSPRNAAICPKLPANASSAAFRPNRVASTRSRDVGLPPRCTCPSTVTRVSKPVRPSISRPSTSPTPRLPRIMWPNWSSSPLSCTPGSSHPSEMTTMEKFFPRAWRLRIDSATSSKSTGCSGMRITSAPPAMP